ncbi:MAG: aldo/keto reductase [Pseudomonadota bacterium]
MRLALGTAQFGLNYGIANQAGQVMRSEAQAMLQLAHLKGIDTLDTAIAYGESETCLGEIGTQYFKVVTKLPIMPDDCLNVMEWVEDQINLSLKRLGANSLYAVLLHRPIQLQQEKGQQLFQALQYLKSIGKTQKIGISIYAPDELDALIPHYSFDLIQAPFNLVDRRLHTSGWLHRLKQQGVEIHTRSAFLQGLLLMAPTAIPAKFLPWNQLWHTWHEWLLHQAISPLYASLAFPLSFPEIDRVVVGADSVQQLEQIIQASKVDLPRSFPEIFCSEENLINPARWSYL